MFILKPFKSNLFSKDDIGTVEEVVRDSRLVDQRITDLKKRSRNAPSFDPERRRFLTRGGLFLGALATGVVDHDFGQHLAQIGAMASHTGYAIASSQSDSQIEPKYRIDLTGVLKNELKEKRESPSLLAGKNPPGRADYDQHTSRGEGSLGGLDVAPLSSSTEIVPVASGYAYRVRDTFGGSGMVIMVYHPFGYITQYLHLKSRFVDAGEKVNRNDVIAIMGDSGANARGKVHLHLNLYGPAYSKYLKGIKINSRNTDHGLDPEEFSIIGKGEELVYQRIDDKLYDENLWKKHFTAQSELGQILAVLPAQDLQKIKEDTNKRKLDAERRLEMKYGIRAIDREIEFLYTAIIKGDYKSLFSKNDEEKILNILQVYMSIVPRLTAPIKEPGGTGYHRLSEKPLKEYGQ